LAQKDQPGYCFVAEYWCGEMDLLMDLLGKTEKQGRGVGLHPMSIEEPFTIVKVFGMKNTH